jgi:hypothetical protein
MSLDYYIRKQQGERAAMARAREIIANYNRAIGAKPDSTPTPVPNQTPTTPPPTEKDVIVGELKRRLALRDEGNAWLSGG